VKVSNSLLFAVRQLLQHGGYIVMRKSHHGWWPHFLWSADLVTFEEFQPIVPAHTRRLPPLLFRGYVNIFNDEF
jgi:hypothetical protein